MAKRGRPKKKIVSDETKDFIAKELKPVVKSEPVVVENQVKPIKEVKIVDPAPFAEGNTVLIEAGTSFNFKGYIMMAKGERRKINKDELERLCQKLPSFKQMVGNGLIKVIK